jgi:hypothetical protein
MTTPDLIHRLKFTAECQDNGDTVKAYYAVTSLIEDLEKEISDGALTARGRNLTEDYTLWHRPHGPDKPGFLMDWGTKEGMEMKLSQMTIEPPIQT